MGSAAPDLRPRPLTDEASAPPIGAARPRSSLLAVAGARIPVAATDTRVGAANAADITAGFVRDGGVAGAARGEL